ncbi:hypothetical protein BB8028_0002g14480 [Beauveria bassiana]|uniref:Uncharacterized protein n=1 Tax=Beauveria bassiana TaxID=176275 RepID=A0A2S7Y4T3_BEABA|nr:hypothetical protein BB8028_0002g14480 [Beauveria bassiana]
MICSKNVLKLLKKPWASFTLKRTLHNTLSARLTSARALPGTASSAVTLAALSPTRPSTLSTSTSATAPFSSSRPSSARDDTVRYSKDLLISGLHTLHDYGMSDDKIKIQKMNRICLRP